MKRFIVFLLFTIITQHGVADVMTCDVNISKYRAQYEINSYTCQSGQYLPAHTLGCIACPNGFTCSGGTFDFNPNIFQGINFNSVPGNTINNACADNFPEKLRALYRPNSHTCNPGYYVPANNDGCVICPADSYCAGGTYSFNETTTQGITACPDNKTSPAGSDDVSDCTVAGVTCAAGYYLPANAIACETCPANSYCVGGTHSPSDTVPQGIMSCAAGLYSPAGAKESAQCGRILHIGDDIMYLRSDKITSPALHIDVDHDGVADFFGNMTTADVVMHAGSERKFKVKYGDTIYSVYDDTVTLPAE